MQTATETPYVTQYAPQPTDYPTRAALVAALLAAAVSADTDEDVGKSVAGMMAAARKCGYLTSEQCWEIEEAFVDRNVRGDATGSFAAFVRANAEAIEAAGEPSDTPKPTTINATKEVQHGIVQQLKGLIGTTQQHGLTGFAVRMAADAITYAMLEGFVSMEQVRDIIDAAHPNGLTRGAGTPESFIAVHEQFLKLIEASHDAPERLVCYTNDGPKDEYPVKTLPLDGMTSAAASALFGGIPQQPRNRKSRNNNSPVA